MTTTLRIGTRGSKLALVQAEMLKNLIVGQFTDIQIETIVIKTSGDIKLNDPLTGQIDKGFFTKEIEDALLSGQIDMAVHSLKDLPVDLPSGLKIGAYLERANPLDVLISGDGRTIDQLTENDVIATSSLRRKAQLLAYNPQFSIIDIRGNVDTRLRKLDEGYCSAIILAAAGVERIGLMHRITQYLPSDIMLPAPGQAAIAVEIRENDEHTTAVVSKLNHLPTQTAVELERFFLKSLGGGCHVPAGCLCTQDGEELHFELFVEDTDSHYVERASVGGSREEVIDYILDNWSRHD